ncbi:hypothetical protein J2TS6_19100 [Paenibacillus albilobatus]|uniref:Uncharacterized protein n=1 Tax=Paenibacillus albilobatus TaxID=2716884 RepID=A0A919XDX9_9BACL|nr:hypothetical protein J2TS6_19100 [Paenibacillus albilobatus]
MYKQRLAFVFNVWDYAKVSVRHRQAGEYLFPFHYRQPAQILALITQDIEHDIGGRDSSGELTDAIGPFRLEPRHYRFEIDRASRRIKIRYFAVQFDIMREQNAGYFGVLARTVVVMACI